MTRIPEITFDNICIHLPADPEFSRVFGKRVKDCGGKFSDIRGMTSTRFVTVPATEMGLLDEIVDRFPANRLPILLEGFSADGESTYRVKLAVGQNGQFNWSPKAGSPSEFIRRNFAARIERLPWDTITARWKEDDTREASQKRTHQLSTEIAALRERIAYEAARLAEGANDWDTIRDLGNRYIELCAEAGIDLSIEPGTAPAPVQ